MAKATKTTTYHYYAVRDYVESDDVTVDNELMETFVQRVLNGEDKDYQLYEWQTDPEERREQAIQYYVADQFRKGHPLQDWQYCENCFDIGAKPVETPAQYAEEAKLDTDEQGTLYGRELRERLLDTIAVWFEENYGRMVAADAHVEGTEIFNWMDAVIKEGVSIQAMLEREHARIQSRKSE